MRRWPGEEGALVIRRRTPGPEGVSEQEQGDDQLPLSGDAAPGGESDARVDANPGPEGRSTPGWTPTRRRIR